MQVMFTFSQLKGTKNYYKNVILINFLIVIVLFPLVLNLVYHKILRINVVCKNPKC